MSSLARFSFGDNPVRFVNGLPVAIDVARALGYIDVSNAISRKVDADYKQLGKLSTLEKEELGIRNDEIITLLEPGIYQLIFSSNLPSAKAFQKWVFEEVLPELRKTGEFKAQPQPKLNIYAHRVEIASKWNIPDGYWCVFHEISLMANAVGKDYNVQQYDLLDGSVGICWSKYRKGQEWALDTVQFPIFFEDNRDLARVNINGYADEELRQFRSWLRYTYKIEKLPKYLEKKYGALVKV